jgi:hypothetical protein
VDAPPGPLALSARGRLAYLFAAAGTGILMLGTFGVLLSEAPGLSVLFAAIALPTVILLVRVISRRLQGEDDHPVLRGIALTLLVIGGSLFALTLALLVVGVIVFLICTASLVRGHP